MYEVFGEKKEALARIEKIVENLFTSNRFFQEKLDKAEMIENLVKLFGQS